MLFRTLILKVSGWPVMERTVRRSKLFRGLVARFIPGDTLEDAIAAAEDLVRRGYLTTLDLLGENVKSVEEAVAAKDSYLAILERLQTSACRSKTNISIKLTQCGFDQGDELTEKHYLELLQAAEAKGGCFVCVDMEASEYTERTVRLVEKLYATHKNTGTVLQSALHRTPQDARKLIDLGMRVRIVKGAYLEPERVAYQDKAKVDEAYLTVAKQLLEAGNYPSIASHDEGIIEQLLTFIAEKGIAKDSFEFQMLYGIRRDLQERLRGQGYNVCVYIPYGASWYPYFTRRLAERPANVLFILKSLSKG